jgi:hypothetical protein
MIDNPPPDLPFVPAALDAARQAFFSRFDAFCAATGRAPGGVSDSLFGSVRKAEALRSKSADVKLGTLAEADAKLEVMAKLANVFLPERTLLHESQADTLAPRLECEDAG